MVNQLFQVFRTYYTRRIYWIYTFCTIPFLILTLGHSNTFTNTSVDMFPIVLINIIIGFIVGMQIKEQYANPRARLLPGFSAAHLIVPAIIITAALLLEACIVNINGVPYFALAGYALFLIAPASWNAYNMRGDYNIIFTVFMCAALFLPKYFVIPLLTGGYFVSITVFCIGVIALAALGLRVVMLNEEMSEYSRVMPGSKWDYMSRSARRERGRLEAQIIARSRIKTWLQDNLFLFVFRNKTVLNPPRRFLLRQLTGGFVGVIIAILLFTIIPVCLCFPELFSMKIGKESSVMSFFMISLLCILMNLISIVVGNNSGSWLQRWQYLARESLFPISRVNFARELVRYGMFDVAAAAVGFLSGTIVGLATSHPETLVSGFISLFIAIIIAQIIMVGSAMLYLVSYRSFTDYFLGCLGIVFLSLVLFCLAIFGNWLLSSISFVATAAVSVGFYRLAFRRWCEIDLD
jgi:hypothetical protein